MTHKKLAGFTCVAISLAHKKGGVATNSHPKVLSREQFHSGFTMKDKWQYKAGKQRGG